MSNQNSLWAGIAIGLGMAMLAGVVGMFASGTIPTPDIARLLATSTHTPTLTPAPTPTLSAEAICRANTTIYIRGLNQILLMMIDTNDTKPKETGQTMRQAEKHVAELSLPECADNKLRTIVTSIRSSIPLYISWTDALQEDDLFDATEYEAQADAQFVLTDYILYLEKNAYTTELQQFQTDSNRIATKTAEYPTRTPVSDLALYRTCVKDVFAFMTEVESIRETTDYHLETLEFYAQGGSITGIDPVWIDRLYETLENVEAPTCIDEPQEIVYLLRISLNTLKPGFIEIKVESDAGRPSAASYKRVSEWVQEIKGFKKNIAVNYKLMPSSLAQLLSNNPSAAPTPNPNSMNETSDDKPLNEYSLQPKDLPKGLRLVEAKYRTNEDTADAWDDPVTALANFERLGRNDSYQASYSRSNGSTFEQAGTDLLTVGVTSTATSADSSELLKFLLISNQDHTVIDFPVPNVDETTSLTLTEPCMNDGKRFQCHTVRVYVRKGNIVAQIIAYAYNGRVDFDLLSSYAQTIADRMNP